MKPMGLVTQGFFVATKNPQIALRVFSVACAKNIPLTKRLKSSGKPKVGASLF